jgi:hypothetical protein
MAEFVNPLADLGDKVEKLTMEIGMKAMRNPAIARTRSAGGRGRLPAKLWSAIRWSGSAVQMDVPVAQFLAGR